MDIFNTVLRHTKTFVITRCYYFQGLLIFIIVHASFLLYWFQKIKTSDEEFSFYLSKKFYWKFYRYSFVFFFNIIYCRIYLFLRCYHLMTTQGKICYFIFISLKLKLFLILQDDAISQSSFLLLLFCYDSWCSRLI